MEQMEEEKYKGAVIRARSERLWLGERPTKRAIGEEKRYATKNEINEIRYHNEVSTGKSVIETAFVERYRSLLGTEVQVNDIFINNYVKQMPRLDEDIKLELERQITRDEIKQAIEDLSKGKTPGPDGLGSAFYKVFKNEVAEILYHVIAEAYDSKQMPPSFKLSHVVLIPKTDEPSKLQ